MSGSGSGNGSKQNKSHQHRSAVSHQTNKRTRQEQAETATRNKKRKRKKVNNAELKRRKKNATNKAAASSFTTTSPVSPPSPAPRASSSSPSSFSSASSSAFFLLLASPSLLLCPLVPLLRLLLLVVFVTLMTTAGAVRSASSRLKFGVLTVSLLSFAVICLESCILQWLLTSHQCPMCRRACRRKDVIVIQCTSLPTVKPQQRKEQRHDGNIGVGSGEETDRVQSKAGKLVYCASRMNSNATAITSGINHRRSGMDDLSDVDASATFPCSTSRACDAIVSDSVPFDVDPIAARIRMQIEIEKQKQHQKLQLQQQQRIHSVRYQSSQETQHNDMLPNAANTCQAQPHLNEPHVSPLEQRYSYAQLAAASSPVSLDCRPASSPAASTTFSPPLSLAFSAPAVTAVRGGRCFAIDYLHSQVFIGVEQGVCRIDLVSGAYMNLIAVPSSTATATSFIHSTSFSDSSSSSTRSTLGSSPVSGVRFVACNLLSDRLLRLCADGSITVLNTTKCPRHLYRCLYVDYDPC